MTDQPIRREKLDAAGRALAFSALAMLNRAFAASEAPVETVASRLSCSPRRVRRLLAGKAALGLREIAELAWAIDGGLIELEITARPR